MKYLMLRGQVPQDRNPNEIIFDKIENCDDMWTQLIYQMTTKDDYSEIWYWGGERVKRFQPWFTERWIKDFKHSYKYDFDPDVIFCRGGFSEYDHIIKKYPDAIKVYYGAGRRFLPNNSKYDLILQDSKEQLKECRKVFPSIPSTTFIKPAADNIFYPMPIEKDYDVVFPANGSQEKLKGHQFVYDKIDHKKYSVLNLGNKGKIKPPSLVHRYRVKRTMMPESLQRAKVGLVCSVNKVDSCPRVIPEMLACDIPIICLKGIRFQEDLYMNEKTGLVVDKKEVNDAIEYVLNNLDKFSAREYYEENLSLKVAAKFIKDKIEYFYG